jgi:riboflavin synthase
MFTGIVSYIGTFKARKNSSFSFGGPKDFLGKLKVSGSVCVNGVCLTVKGIKDGKFNVDVMPETLRRTNLGNLEEGCEVNLELSLRLGDEFGGHMVSGHIDGTAEVKTIKREGNSQVFTFKLAEGLAKYLVGKGSIAVNGVSLTVIAGTGNSFSVGIIPYTLENTNFGRLKVGDSVNIEVDMMAKYVEKLVAKYLKDAKKG